MNPWTTLLDPLAIRQGQRLLGDLVPPEAPPGAPFGAVGADRGPVQAARHLAVLGDEFAGGWGLAGQEQTLAPGLARSAGTGVVWQVTATPAATMEDVHLQMLERLPAAVDVAVVWVGWGDLVARTPTAQWRRELDACLALLGRRGRAVVVGCPPVDAMPRLRAPLSTVLASRAREFDRASEAACRAAGVGFVPLTGFPATDFQDDGVHLSAAGQARVVAQVAPGLW